MLRKGILSRWSGSRVLSLSREFIRISLPLSLSSILRNIIKASLLPFSCEIPLCLRSVYPLCAHEYRNRLENILYKRRWIYLLGIFVTAVGRWQRKCLVPLVIKSAS